VAAHLELVACSTKAKAHLTRSNKVYYRLPEGFAQSKSEEKLLPKVDQKLQDSLRRATGRMAYLVEMTNWAIVFVVCAAVGKTVDWMKVKSQAEEERMASAASHIAAAAVVVAP
jgi:hypothetical protein